MTAFQEATVLMLTTNRAFVEPLDTQTRVTEVMSTFFKLLEKAKSISFGSHNNCTFNISNN